MAIKLLVPWWTYPAGHVVELGETFDQKMIGLGKAEKVAAPKVTVEKAEKPKVKKDGNI
jgi:hypothetical protein